MQVAITPELIITIAGIIGLLAGIGLTLKTISVLRPLVLDLLDLFLLPVSSDMLVSLVYMGGAIYVVLVSFISLGLWRNVAGIPLSAEEAREIFAKHVGNAPSMERFSAKDYSVNCSFCGENVEFSLVDVVSSHADSIERGIEVQSGMGLKMIVIYPRHVCKDGLRETPVKLDDSYKYRSHGESRPV